MKGRPIWAALSLPVLLLYMALRFDYTFVPNDADDLHCLQAVVRMLWQGLFGDELSARNADRVTNFKSGLQTWPFAAMLALADRGTFVSNVEDFDVKQFVADPTAELRRQCRGNEEVVQHILKVSDTQAEIEMARRCLEHPSIRFDQRVPNFDDLARTACSQATGVICNINYRAMVGEPGYNGHFILVDSIGDDDDVRIQDPGLPPLADHVVDKETFVRAWGGPDSGLPNMIVFSVS